MAHVVSRIGDADAAEVRGASINFAWWPPALSRLVAAALATAALAATALAAAALAAAALAAAALAAAATLTSLACLRALCTGSSGAASAMHRAVPALQRVLRR